MEILKLQYVEIRCRVVW